MRTRNAGSKIISAPRARERNLFSRTGAELKAIVEAHKDMRLMPDNSRLSYLLLRVHDACEINHVHMRHGASKSSLESKLKSLDDTQATALMVWASAFWVSRNCSAESLDEYIRAY